MTVKPRGNNARIIDDKRIGGTQIFGYIVKMPVLDIAGRSVYDHEPRCITHLGGVLCYKLLGKIIVKIMRGQFSVRLLIYNNFAQLEMCRTFRWFLSLKTFSAYYITNGTVFQEFRKYKEQTIRK